MIHTYTMRLETHYTAILGMGEEGALEYNRNRKIIQKIIENRRSKMTFNQNRKL